MTSPFGCNKKNLFGNPAKDKGAPEPVILVAEKNSVITGIIPYGTKQANNIRSWMHANVVTTDGARIFIYRSINGWTNISLESTESAPKLTCDPVTTLITAWREFNKCPAVGTLQIKWKGSDTVLGFDDIANMESEFEPVPEPSGSNEEEVGTSKTDAEILQDMVAAQSSLLDDQSKVLEKLDTKLAHLIAMAESAADKELNDETPTPKTSKSTGKRKASK
jgi:hypothetical protein